MWWFVQENRALNENEAGYLWFFIFVVLVLQIHLCSDIFYNFLTHWLLCICVLVSEPLSSTARLIHKYFVHSMVC